MFKSFTTTPEQPVNAKGLLKSPARNTKQTASNTDPNTCKVRCHKITVRIMDNPNISLHCDQINQHRESGRVPLTKLMATYATNAL